MLYKKYIRLYICILILSLYTHSYATSQNIVYKGRVISSFENSNGQKIKLPISGMNIKLVGSSISTFSDFNGVYDRTFSELDLAKTVYIAFFHENYNTLVLPIKEYFSAYNSKEIEFTNRKKLEIIEGTITDDNLTIEGNIVNSKNKGISNVSISISNLSFICKSDFNGKFFFKVKKTLFKNYSTIYLYFDKQGYFEHVIPIKIRKDNDSYKISISLEEKQDIKLTPSDSIFSFFDFIANENIRWKKEFEVFKNIVKQNEDETKNNVKLIENIEILNKSKLDSSKVKDLINQKVVENQFFLKKQVELKLDTLIDKYNLKNKNSQFGKKFTFFINTFYFVRPDNDEGLFSNDKSPFLTGIGFYPDRNGIHMLSITFNIPCEKKSKFWIIPKYHISFPTSVKNIYWQIGTGLMFNKEFNYETNREIINSYLFLDIPFKWDLNFINLKDGVITLGATYSKILKSKDDFFGKGDTYNYFGLSLNYTIRLKEN